MKKQTMIEFSGGGASCNPAPVRVFLKFTLLGQFMSFVGDLFSLNSSPARYRFENKSPTNFFAKKQSKDEMNSSPLTVHRLLNNETAFSRFTSHFSLPHPPRLHPRRSPNHPRHYRNCRRNDFTLYYGKASFESP